MNNAITSEQLEAILYDQHPVATGIKAVFAPDDVIEVRAFNQRGEKYTGRYMYGRQVVSVIEAMDEEGFDVYYVLNPVGNKLGLRDLAAGGGCTREQDIPHRRWFLLDFDSRRSHKIATWEQFRAAFDTARKAKAWLLSMGMEAKLASSGNGAHLLVRANLPNVEKSKAMIHAVQRTVADQFSSEAVEVECFADANRLVRSYGTINKKGEETEELKYNVSAIL